MKGLLCPCGFLRETSDSRTTGKSHSGSAAPGRATCAGAHPRCPRSPQLWGSWCWGGSCPHRLVFGVRADGDGKLGAWLSSTAAASRAAPARSAGEAARRLCPAVGWEHGRRNPTAPLGLGAGRGSGSEHCQAHHSHPEKVKRTVFSLPFFFFLRTVLH